MWLQLTLLVPLCALVCGQPWTRMDVQYDALSPRQNYRVVCPKSFAVNRDDPDEAHPFWMAQPKLLHVFHSAKPRPAHDVALVTHLNADRLHALHVQCRFWGGTIAAALYLPLLDGAFTFADDPEHVQEYSRQVLKNAATVEEVKEKLVAWYQNHMEAQELPCKLDLAVYIEHIKDRSEWSTYPNNAMRNRALALATTEVVLLLDSDFVPGPLQWNMALVQDNTTHQQVVQMLGNGSNVAVLSALDTNSTSLTSLYDHHAWARRALQYGTKPNLSQWIEEGHVVQFQDFGHAETNWSRWKDAQEAYSVEYKTFDGVWPSEYEPFFIARRNSLPWYDERYRGYYNNKMSFVWTVKMLGMQFMVHADAFVLHYAHARSVSIFEAPERNKEMTTKLYWHTNPERVRQGCGVPLPFVADVSADCTSWGMQVNTTACKGYAVEPGPATTE